MKQHQTRANDQGGNPVGCLEIQEISGKHGPCQAPEKF